MYLAQFSMYYQFSTLACHPSRIFFLKEGITSKDVPIGGVGASRPPKCSNLQEILSNDSHAARELPTVFSVTFFLSNNSWSIGQITPPPQQKASRHITEYKQHSCYSLSSLKPP